MKYIILFTLTVFTYGALAQPVYVDRIGFKLESIADIEIGWMKTYQYNAAPKGLQLGDRVYSAQQIGYSQQLIKWMQQSYLPKGCLADANIYQNYIPKFSATNSLLGNTINTHKQALPQLYGAMAKIYVYLKKDAQGKFVPQNNLGEFWDVAANQLERITKPVSFISSTEEYYFLLPDYKNSTQGYEEADKSKVNFSGFDNHENLKPYQHFFIPSDGEGQYVVIMTKDNQALPFEKITIGEFFTEAEKQFPVWQKINPLTPESYAKAQKNLSRLKEKYHNKWNDVAEINIKNNQLDLNDFVYATEGYDDLFDKKDNASIFPILKVKKVARELCKTNQPQWIVIRWSLGLTNERYYVHLHESILNNFNYEYVYNFFFDPEKVKDKLYQPLRSPSFKEAVTINAASSETKTNNADASIFFFEDFSATPVGNKPTNWQAKLANYGTSAIVANPSGLQGNWVQLTGHQIMANLPKRAWPQNFNMTYDLAVPENFTWGAKGLTMQLSNEPTPGNKNSFISLKLRPGSNGADGEAALETKFNSAAGYLTGTKWYVANGFSNNKKVNKISVSVIKKGEMLQLFINKNKIVEHEKAMPNTQIFNALSFDCGGNTADNDRYYISNIKITEIK